MLQAKTNNHEANFVEALLRLESLPKPPHGNTQAGSQLNQKGLRFLASKNLPESIQSFTAAVEADPSDAEFINNLGWAELLAGLPEQAEDNIYRALSLAPSRAVAWGNLGELLRRAGKTDSSNAAFAIKNRFLASKVH
jgi:Flp pilus assembly protein TadD